MSTRHPLPAEARAWLTEKAFQVMPLKGTRPWPGQPEYWVEVSVTGDQASPILFMRATTSAAPGKRGRHTAYCGTAIEVKRDATTEVLDAAYQHFLDLNQAATGTLSGCHKYPAENHPHGRPPAPAVK